VVSSMIDRLHVSIASLAVLATAVACSPGAGTPAPPSARYELAGPLIPSRTTMVTAWDFPKNPLTDPTLDDSRLSADIRWGFRIFTNTPAEAARFTPSKVSCNNCHLNGGQRERSLPLVGVAGMFPEYNRRSGRLYTLGDRIVDCFLRSQNATGMMERVSEQSLEDQEGEVLPSTTSKEVLALSAYITWLARGYEVGSNPEWRGRNAIQAARLIPVAQLDPRRGEALFIERCTTCHGTDGQGVAVGDKKPGPLWGPDSWNDGAGAARIYTLAGIIRYAMPYLDPGSLTDEEAQLLAAFITSKPRPSYPFKHQDYRTEKLPVDSVYYPQRAISGQPSTLSQPSAVSSQRRN
jgi:thiosulfate dehydrogenase